jgi:dihydroorotase
MIISDVIVCDVSGERRADVRLVDGKIAEVGEALQGEPRMEGRGAYLLPGIVDTNVRLKDGQLNGKNIGSVADEARKGGVTRIVLAPDSAPSVDNGIVLEFVQKHRSQESGVVVETTIASTDEEERLTDIAILLKKGAKAPYMTTAISNNTACRIAEYVKMYKSTLFCKAQDTSLSSVGVMVEGSVATKLGLVGIPPFGEVVHVARMIEIARNFGIGILFKSIASPRSIELITKAKEEGVDVKCEVSLHHLLHSDEACEGFNTTAKLNPPLARREDMQRLQEALKKGQIDMLTLLHQPNTPVSKEVAFADAAYGCEAIAEAYSLYYTKLVKSGLIDMPTLVKLAVQNPALSIGVRAGRIEPGADAQLVLLDPDGEVEVQNPQSLYHGETLSGRVVVV